MATHRWHMDLEPAADVLARVTQACRRRGLVVHALDYARFPATARITVSLETGTRPLDLVTAQLSRVPGVLRVRTPST